MTHGMADNAKRMVQKQFGSHASEFVTSSVHAQGYSLKRLVELVKPQKDWLVLDVATGGGHTALAFAEVTGRVVAVDLTSAILLAARTFAQSRTGDPIAFAQSDAEHMPFPSGQFDCITCRIAAHHVPDIPAFMKEVIRVMKPGSLFALVDNVVSGEPAIAEFVNSFEKLRDPSHQWAYSVDDWETFFFTAGLSVVERETIRKEMDFADWAGRMGVQGDDLIRLEALLTQSPVPAHDWLEPHQSDGRLKFTLTEAILIGRKPAAA